MLSFWFCSLIMVSMLVLYILFLYVLFQGDSGGPVFIDKVFMAIHSYHRKANDGTPISIDIDACAYKPWIKNQIGKTGPISSDAHCYYHIEFLLQL